jgi:hypothetical protein
MPRTISTPRFNILKRQAARLKQDGGITHSQALNRIAVENGFSNWSMLAKAVVSSNSQSKFAKPHKMQFYCSVLRAPENAAPYFWMEEILCLHPEKHYADMNWIRTNIRARNREGIAETLATARRAINFMDATGLKTSRAWSSIFRGNTPYGLDHTQVWRDENKRIIITTEPYFASDGKIEKLTKWCKDNEWRLLRAPKNVGIWNCCKASCDVGCSTHTNMFILSPKKNGGDVEKVLSALT